MKLYTYHRNSAGERVRIALNLKAVAYDYVSAPALGHAAYLAVNPQGLMPALEIDGRIIAQSTAILEFLEERYPAPRLLPADPVLRAQVRAFSRHIACEIHPLNNHRVRVYLQERLGAEEPQVLAWYRHWIAIGFEALEAALARREEPWPFCFGDAPGWADLHLIPQLRNARRFDCDLTGYPRLTEIESRCNELDAFHRARPEQQPDFSMAKKN